jgi:predicted acylesterase/phospholipase RssA
MIAFSAGAVLVTAGCRQTNAVKNLNTPVKAGLNTRDLVDPPAQDYADKVLRNVEVTEVAKEMHAVVMQRAAAADPARANRPPKNVLCLSGGGSFGAFSAGVIYGWTCAGTRPVFDTVTGISTGSLIAPMAFLGPRYDEQMKRFYTAISTKDVYTQNRLLKGLTGEALADNAPLGKMLDGVLTDEFILEIAGEHQKGRRLYVGTTELEGKQFVVWNIGAIACNQGPAGKCLIKKILLGSAGIPGFFPSSKIPVSVDGKGYVEKHVDGGVSQGIFFRPPYIPEAELRPQSYPLAGTKIWAIVAGKLYADPATVKPNSLEIAGTAVGDVVYAQTRGDLQRMFTLSLLTGMEMNISAIPTEFAAPKSATDFSSGPMLSMFNEGCRLSTEGKAWRKAPPGILPGESPLERDGTCLIQMQRGPVTGGGLGSNNQVPLAPGGFPIPVVPSNLYPNN